MAKQWLAAFLESNFTELAGDQFLTAFAWVIAALQDADDPRTRAKDQGCSPRPTQDKNVDYASLWSLLSSCYQLLIGMAYFLA